MKTRKMLTIAAMLLAVLILVSASPGAIAPVLSFAGLGNESGKNADRAAGLLLFLEAVLAAEYLRRYPLFSD